MLGSMIGGSLLNQTPARSGARPAQQYARPEDVDSTLRSLADSGVSMVATLGKALDTPGAIARGILAGDPASGFSWDQDRRVSGQELLDSYGLFSPSASPGLKTASGIAAEIVTDPLTWLTGPMGAYTRGGRAVQAAGLMDLAPVAAQRRMGAAAADTLTGRFTQRALNQLGKEVAPDAASTLAVRPLVGPRLARATTTVREVVNESGDAADAISKITNYLSPQGLTFDDVADEKLGGLFGVGFVNSSNAYTPAGSEKLLDAMDLIGQGIGWSKPARTINALFDQRLAGQTDEAGQILALKHSKELSRAREEGRRLASQHSLLTTDLDSRLTPQAKQLLGADSLLSEQGNDLLLRLHENKATAQDLALLQAVPDLNAALSSWDRIRRHNVDSAKRLGLAINEYSDEFGTLYNPRTGTAYEFDEYGTGVGLSLYNTRTENAFGRSSHLAVPGGTADLREISLLPIVREHARLGKESPYTFEQVGAVIKDYVDRKHGTGLIDQDRGEAIARVMYRLKKDLPANYPAFAEHPINTQAQSIVAQEMARANAKFVYDSLAEAAVSSNANQLVGGGYKTMQAGLHEIAQKIGLRTDENNRVVAEAVDQLRQRLSSRMGIPADQIDLANIAIPEKLIDRLGRMQDFYSSPRAQQEVLSLLDGFTSLNKSFLLAWPSRHARDAISNAFSLWLETGSVQDTLDGFRLGASVVGGEWDSAIPLLRQLPQYARLGSDDAVRRQYIADVAGTGILTGLTQSDYLTANRVGEISRLVPGVQPLRLTDAVTDLTDPAGWSEFGRIKGVTDSFRTANPILNASSRLNDYNDSVARIGGMFALMRQGLDARQAANRIQQALVMYDSMTPFEVETMRRIFPWWAYNSRIGKYAVTSLLENPGGRFGQAIRAMNTLQASDQETYIPQNMREQFAMRIPDSLLQSAGFSPRPGEVNVLTDLDFPAIDTLNLFAPGSVQNTLSNLAGQMNPFAQSFIELSTDRDVFTKRPLSQSNSGVDRIYKALSGDERPLPAPVRTVLENIPGLQRPLNLVGGMLDQRIPSITQRALKQGFNALSGMKTATVTEAERLQDAVNQLADRNSNYIEQLTIPYIPEGRKAQATPEVLREIGVMQQLKRQADELRAQRRRQRQYDSDLLGL